MAKEESKKQLSKGGLIALALASAAVVAIGVNQFAIGQDSDSSSESSIVETEETATSTIVETAVATESLSTLVAAVTEANLVDTLNSDGPFTVFAPTDEAFAALLSELGVTADELLARDDLGDILTYHVVPAKALSGDLTDGQVITTVQGQDLTVKIEDGMVMINDAMVITADVETSNGVVHIIDSVLLPSADDSNETSADASNGTVVDIAVNNNFNTLVAAVTEAGLAETLSGDGPFTVFAPTDEAFAALLSELGVTADELLARDDLGDILKYHVVSGNVLAGDLVSGTNVDTLLGQEWHVVINDSGVFIANPNTAEIIAEVVQTDIVGTNGIVHVIDSVLLPQ